MWRRLALLGTVALLSLQVASASATSSEPGGESVDAAYGERTDCGLDALDGLQTDMTGALANRAEDLQAKYGELPGLVAILFGSDGFSFVVQGDVDSWAAIAKEAGIRVYQSCVPEDLAAAVHESVADQNYAKGEFAIAGYNAFTDSLDVATTNDGARLRDRVASAVERLPAGVLRISNAESGQDVRFAGRLADSPPFFGGGRIISQFGDGCSTGFYISSATYGTTMVTAGHCAGNGVQFANGNLTLIVGTMEGSSLPNPDLGLLDGASYSARSFSAGNTTSSKPITEDAEPITGTTYCQFGSVSYRKCASYSSLNYQICDASGCTSGLAFTARECSSPLAAGGDSGGGVFREYADATIGPRAIVVGGGQLGTGNTCFRVDHRRNTITSFYSAVVLEY